MSNILVNQMSLFSNLPTTFAPSLMVVMDRALKRQAQAWPELV